MTNTALILVGYAFSYTRTAPRIKAELYAHSSIQAQLSMIAAVYRASKIPMIEPFLDYATNRSSVFCGSRQFREFVGRAEGKSWTLILDLNALFRMTSPDLISAAAAILDGIAVELIDASTSTSWTRMDDITKSAILTSARYAGAARSNSIKAGLRKVTSERTPPPAENRLRANAVRARRAQGSAESLRGFVDNFVGLNAPGKPISPTSLARELNIAGKLSPRGKPWSHNAAKLLLQRLKSIK
jgi:hypothetical protein